jgi:uncharacterized protein YndB with AHSA1/START domain
MTLQNQEFTLTREIKASPSIIYAAFTTTAGWCAWCCETAESDPIIGGKLHIYTEGYNAHGRFTDLKEDHLVAFTWDGDGEPPTSIRVLIDDRNDNALMTFKVTCLDAEAEWTDFSVFLVRIWGRALDNLKIILEGEHASQNQ